MDFKILPKPSANTSLRVLPNNSLLTVSDLIKTNSTIMATVLECSLRNKSYLLNFSGKQIRLVSDVKLFIGEKLELRIQHQGHRIELEILRRSMGVLHTDSEEIVKGWSKNYFSPFKIMQNAFESKNSEISTQKVFQFLDVYFPGIEWNGNTPFFEWRFEDGEANGFYGKREDIFSFYFHLQSKHLGEVDSYFHWKKSDFSDFVLHSVFDTLEVYLYANEKLPELKKMLSSNSISANDIIFHYSTGHKGKGDWIA